MNLHSRNLNQVVLKERFSYPISDQTHSKAARRSKKNEKLTFKKKWIKTQRYKLWRAESRMMFKESSSLPLKTRSRS